MFCGTFFLLHFILCFATRPFCKMRGHSHPSCDDLLSGECHIFRIIFLQSKTSFSVQFFFLLRDNKSNLDLGYDVSCLQAWYLAICWSVAAVAE